MYIPFKEMPETARIWIYQSNRKLNKEEKEFLMGKLTAFCDQWNTHGALMPSSFDLLHDQFIILAVDESKLGASGCSIDSSVRTLREIEQRLGVNLLDQGKISFIEDGNVITSKLQEIKEYIHGGNLKEETPVFNPMINKKEDLSEKWLIPANESWLKKFFVN
jgi:hypothetical protein